MVSGLGLSVTEEIDSRDPQPELCLKITSASLEKLCAQAPRQKVLIHLFQGWGPGSCF